MSNDNNILDKEFTGKDPPGFFKKIDNYFEGVIRLGFYGYLIYSLIITIFHKLKP